MAPDPKAQRLTLLLLLFAAGWAANHFVVIIAVMQAGGAYPTGSLEAAFGLYALGLLPSLLLGGALADRAGARLIAVGGASLAAVGNVSLMLSASPLALSLGRLVVGVGVGLAISAGTAWMGRLSPSDGAALAGTVLTAGFCAGPAVAGVIAQPLDPPPALLVPFALSIALSGVSVVAVLWAGRGGGTARGAAQGVAARPASALRPASPASAPPPSVDDGRSVARALVRALPISLWVFACPTLSMVVFTNRMGGFFGGPLAAGTMALLTLGTGVTVQVIARRRGWGPWSSVAGVLCAALGLAVGGAMGAAATPAVAIPCAVVLGFGYGLSLRGGLSDVDRFAPARARGVVGGIFYVGAYTGFALPYALEVLQPVAGPSAPLYALACGAVAAAALRAVQVRRG